VRFDEASVSSLDQSSYPIPRFEEAPAVTPIIVADAIDRPQPFCHLIHRLVPATLSIKSSNAVSRSGTAPRQR
jgi:hypothetical protein